jgi:hypothetical protein
VKFATLLVVALLSFALGALACAISSFLGFIGGIALKKDEPIKSGPRHVAYRGTGPPPSA